MLNAYYITYTTPIYSISNYTYLIRPRPPSPYESSPIHQSFYYSTIHHFSLLHSVHTGSGANPSSYLMGTGSDFYGDKAAGEWN
jgi:hypothetical protein